MYCITFMVNKDNTKEKTKKFLDMPCYDFGDKWLEEIDTAGVDMKLERIRKNGKSLK